eukprot:scaffold1817_cov250-Pinguiococcus_pyrenoidosus.AAC.1
MTAWSEPWGVALETLAVASVQGSDHGGFDSSLPLPVVIVDVEGTIAIHPCNATCVPSTPPSIPRLDFVALAKVGVRCCRDPDHIPLDAPLFVPVVVLDIEGAVAIRARNPPRKIPRSTTVACLDLCSSFEVLILVTLALPFCADHASLYPSLSVAVSVFDVESPVVIRSRDSPFEVLASTAVSCLHLVAFRQIYSIRDAIGPACMLHANHLALDASLDVAVVVADIKSTIRIHARNLAFVVAIPTPILRLDCCAFSEVAVAVAVAVSTLPPATKRPYHTTIDAALPVPVIKLNIKGTIAVSPGDPPRKESTAASIPRLYALTLFQIGVIVALRIPPLDNTDHPRLDASLFLTVVVVDVERTIPVVTPDPSRVEATSTPIPRLHLRTLTKPWLRISRSVRAAGAAAVVIIKKLDQALADTPLLLTVVIVDVERTVAVVSSDDAGVPSALASVSRLDFGALTQFPAAIWTGAPSISRTVVGVLNFDPAHQALLDRPLFLPIVVVDVKRPVAIHPRDTTFVPATSTPVSSFHFVSFPHATPFWTAPIAHVTKRVFTFNIRQPNTTWGVPGGSDIEDANHILLDALLLLAVVVVDVKRP